MNVIINQADLKRLDNFVKPTLFIANQPKKKKQEKVLKSFLGNKYPDLIDISLNINKPKKLIRSIEKIIEDRNQAITKPVLMLSVAFAPQKDNDLIYQKQLNKCFDWLKKLNIDMVLVSIISNKLIGIDNLTDELPTKGALQIRISPKIESIDIALLKKGYEFRRFVQSRLFAMNALNTTKANIVKLADTDGRQAKIAEPTDSSLVVSEIDLLRYWGFRVVEQSNFEVFVADSALIPHALREIGRLRETTFRAVSEGTGNEIDIDDFDFYYKQLVIWDKTESRIVGGYRIGLGDRVFAQYGVNGFYISTLFKILRFK